MTTIGKILLIIGIGVTAAFGARNPQVVDDQSSASSRAAQAAAAAAEMLDAYCDAREEAELALSEACAPADVEEDAELAADASAPSIADAYDTWQAAMLVSESANEAVAAMEAPPTGERLSAWFGLAGLPFLAGLLLVIGGSVMVRIGMKAELSGGGSGDGAGPVDFGHMLTELRGSVGALATEIEAAESPSAEHLKRWIEQIEALQLEAFEPLVNARLQVQTRYGMGTFAAIFGPLSGGERFVNRAWAALVDAHHPEALRSLRSAEAELATAVSEIPS